MKEMDILFEVINGAHAWRMEHSQSDLDIFRCYLADYEDILIGKTPKNSFYVDFTMIEGRNVDIQTSEIGTTIQQLIKNNLNYIVNVNSQIIRVDNGGVLANLRDFSRRGLSKELYGSFHGMAIHNYNKYIRDFDDVKKIPEHRLNKIARVLALGIRLLNGEPIELRQYSGATVIMIETMIRDLDTSLQESKLPEQCPIEEEMLDYLVTLRLNDIISREEGYYSSPSPHR